MTTQVEMLIRHFESLNSIIPMEAHTIYNIRSLPRRILDLKERGYQFRAEWNKDLTGQRYKRYYLTHTPQEETTGQDPATLTLLQS